MLAAAFAKPDPKRGVRVFEQCRMCHTADGEPKKTGPTLLGLFRKSRLRNGKKTTTSNVLAIINHGAGPMPSYKTSLNDRQKKDLIAYLKTL